MTISKCLWRSMLIAAMMGIAPIAAFAVPSETLRVGIGTDPDTLDPLKAYLPISTTVDLLIFDGLFTLDADNNPQKNLATDYSYSDDGMVLTVKMVTGRKFSSGAPLDAAVAASFERLLDPDNGSIYLGLYKTLGVVKAVGDDTVEFHLSEKNGHALLLLASTAASIVDVVAAETADADFTRFPIGSGPYVVKEYIGGERFSLVPNSSYDGSRPATLAQIDFVTAPEDGSRMALMETGDIDIVERVLGLSEHTVRCYLESARHKLGAANNGHAANKAAKANLLTKLP